MTFGDIKPGDSIWYQSHRQFDLLLSATVISVERCRKRYCLIKFYHDTHEEELQVSCLCNREADNYVATSKEALKNYLIDYYRKDDEMLKQRIEAEIKRLKDFRESIKTSIEKIEKA